MATTAVTLLAWTADAHAQLVIERYVKTTANLGSYSNRGTSWDDAMDNLQEAINDARTAMLSSGAAEARVYVAAGKYNPTESTENTNSNILHASFLMYEGITVYGGYPDKATSTEANDGVDGQVYVADSDPNLRARSDLDGDGEIEGWEFTYLTILSGNHSNIATDFTYAPARGQYVTRFPSNSYHVVWFGTKGVIDDATAPNHRQGFTKSAGVDGVIIEEGFASSKEYGIHNHMAYGGGAYLVDKTFLRNCVIRRCQSTARGGGVYLDGGGTVDHCFIHTCQTTGVAIAEGYGGGVCIDYNGEVKYSHIAQSTARIGGGLAICHTPSEYPVAPGDEGYISPYQPYAVACIIANNTSNAEGGGVYLDEGGTINHCTVVKNNCIGPDITYYGRRHGRAGGIYVRNHGMLYNSVLWGNECAANNDIQFATIRQTTATSARVDVFHCALYNQDITDWTNVNKEEVFSLTAYNRPHRAGVGNCCWFEVNPEILGPEGEGSLKNDLRAGVNYDENMQPKDAQWATTWRPRHASDLAMKGVQVSQTVHVSSEWIRHAHTATDILGVEYELSSTIGAIAHSIEGCAHTLLLPQGKEGRAIATPTDNDRIPTVFVCSQRDAITQSAENYYGNFGETWEHSMVLITDAINYFEEFRVKSGENKNKYKFPDDPKYYPAVQILVKEGLYTTAGKGNYEGNDIRTAALRPKSNMRIYGGYPSQLTGTDVSVRNPKEYESFVSCNIVGGYENNTAHAFGLINVQNVIIDGIAMGNGNVINMQTDAIVKKGTGIIASNTTISQDERIDMTGNVLRNSSISNTHSYDGAAIYINALMPKAGGETVRAELTVENTVIRNCTAQQDETMEDNEESAGIVVANGRATVNVDHCTIANNVGYPLKTLAGAGHEGEIVITNSVLYANSATAVDDRDHISNFAATYRYNSSGQITGHNNMIDAGAPQETALTDVTTNQYNLTTTAGPNFPTFKNPSYNVGHSETVDRPLYGGSVDFEPLNTNPVVNAADDATMANFDQTDNNHFDYGGAADLGAIENTSLPKNGTVIYVTPDGAGRRDGSSWGNAIAGNTIYALNGAAAAGTDALDDANGTTRIINTDPTIGTGADKGVLTTDSRYCGGFAMTWIQSKVTGGEATIEETIRNVSQHNTYSGGEKDGDESDHNYIEHRREVVSSTEGDTPDDGFEPGFYPDDRYPYGEKSGMSRAFWHANDNGTPYGSTTDPYSTVDNAVKSGNLNINNNRDENYVSGLQYAVEMASAYNTLAEDDPLRKEGIDSLQVWVSNGVYTDYKGFVMRDKTTVLGSFPAVGGDISNPGLQERQTLMSDVVNIPKTKNNLHLDASNYETILQISDVNPRQSESAFNADAIKFQDAEYISEEREETISQSVYDVNITNTYTWDETPEDWTAGYLAFPGFKDGSTNVISDNPPPVETKGGLNYYTFGTVSGDKDCWHMSVPTASKIKKSELSQSKKYTIADAETGATIDNPQQSGVWIWPHDAELTDLSIWQTINNIGIGDYQLQVDLGGGYRNDWTSDVNTNIHFLIIDADGTTVVDHTIVTTEGREKARRHTFSFSQAKEGSLTLKLYVGEGLRPNPDNAGDGTGSPNRREVWMSNLKLTKISAYEKSVVTTGDDSPTSSSERTVTTQYLTEQTVYTTLRERVLTMPDVTIPTYGCGHLLGLGSNDAGGGGGDNLPHTDRVVGPTKAKRKATVQTKYEDPNYVEYSNVFWNGFTIRHGFIYDQTMCHGGGAGVVLYEGAHLQNCVITDNISACMKAKGGGVFCDGATSTVEGCFILNNTTTRGTSINQDQLFAGGMFMYEGTCYNTLIANNYARGFGGGLGLCVGNFYNNTIAYNTSGHSSANGGIRIATGAESAILMANTIIYGNNGAAITMTASANYSPSFIATFSRPQTLTTPPSLRLSTNTRRTETATTAWRTCS